MTKKRAGIALVMIGAVLLAVALLLFAYNRMEDARAGEESAAVLTELQTALQDGEAANTDENKDTEDNSDKVMPTVNIDGYDYIGYLNIPDLELELPVMGDWDYNRLKRAPCRHFGTTYNDDLVIAAHNFKQHFGLLDTLAMGAEVTFTDMDGVVNRYAVREIIQRSPYDVDEVQNSQWDLILYTCTYGGQTRIVAGFERID